MNPQDGESASPEPELPTQTMRLSTSSASLLNGRYQLARELGRGGFGIVYLANDMQLHGRAVVIKVLLERRADEWSQRKFKQECEALSRLDHPGIVGVKDQGLTPDGHAFLALEFVKGTTLRALLKPGRMGVHRAARLLRQMSRALSAAHDAGVFHRDLKPENIMVRDLGGGEEQAVIIDFGIATVTNSDLGGATATKLAGSPRYMAPEQLAGKPVPASDIFALGVIAYEMTTGRLPFESDSPVDMFLKQKAGPAQSPRELCPELPLTAEQAILRALSYDVSARFSRADEFGTAFCEPGEDAASSPPAPRRRLLAGVLAIAALSAGAVYFALHKSGPPANAPPPIALVQAQIEYSITVKGKDGKPFPLAGEMLFPAGYDVALNILAPRPGFLYVLNDGPMPDGSTIINVLYPGPSASAPLPAARAVRIPSQGEFHLDEASGTEKLYLVWSAKPVPEMESIASLNPSSVTGHVMLKDPAQLTQLRQFLTGLQITASGIKKDEEAKKTLLSSNQAVLVHLIRLEHH
jgi:serine/threonine protein kinase